MDMLQEFEGESEERRKPRILSIHLPHSAVDEYSWEARVLEINGELLFGNSILVGDLNQEFHMYENGLVGADYRANRPITQRGTWVVVQLDLGGRGRARGGQPRVEPPKLRGGEALEVELRRGTEGLDGGAARELA